MMLVTTIRAYRESDQENVLRLWSDAAKAAHPFIPDEGEGERREIVRSVYLVQAENWVIEDEAGEVQGVLGLIGNEVGGLFVAPAAQGKGYGRALLEHAAAHKGELVLEVFEKNEKARGFYQHMGFEQTSKRLDVPTGLTLCVLYRAG